MRTPPFYWVTPALEPLIWAAAATLAATLALILLIAHYQHRSN